MSRMCQRRPKEDLEAFRGLCSKLELPNSLTEKFLLSLERWLIDHLVAEETLIDFDSSTVQINFKGMAIGWLRQDNQNTIWWLSRPWENKHFVKELGNILQQLYTLTSQDDGDTTHASKMDKRVLSTLVSRSTTLISLKSARVAPVANMTDHRTNSPPVDHPTEVGNAEGSDDGSSYHETNMESSEDELTTSVRKSQRKSKPTKKAFQTTPLERTSPNAVSSINSHGGFDRGRFPMLRRKFYPRKKRSDTNIPKKRRASTEDDASVVCPHKKKADGSLRNAGRTHRTPRSAPMNTDSGNAGPPVFSHSTPRIPAASSESEDSSDDSNLSMCPTPDTSPSPKNARFHEDSRRKAELSPRSSPSLSEGLSSSSYNDEHCDHEISNNEYLNSALKDAGIAPAPDESQALSSMIQLAQRASAYPAPESNPCGETGGAGKENLAPTAIIFSQPQASPDATSQPTQMGSDQSRSGGTHNGDSGGNRTGRSISATRTARTPQASPTSITQPAHRVSNQQESVASSNSRGEAEILIPASANHRQVQDPPVLASLPSQGVSSQSTSKPTQFSDRGLRGTERPTSSAGSSRPPQTSSDLELSNGKTPAQPTNATSSNTTAPRYSLRFFLIKPRGVIPFHDGTFKFTFHELFVKVAIAISRPEVKEIDFTLKGPNHRLDSVLWERTLNRLYPEDYDELIDEVWEAMKLDMQQREGARENRYQVYLKPQVESEEGGIEATTKPLNPLR